MRRYLLTLVHKLNIRMPAVWGRLPGIADMVRTSLVYAAVTVLFVGIAASLLLYQSWRHYGNLRGIKPQAAAAQENAESTGRPQQAVGGQRESPEPPRPRAEEEQALALKKLGADARAEKMQRPLSGKIVASYGWQEDKLYKDWRFNAGVDVAIQTTDNTVKAVKSGKVKEVVAGSRGIRINIEHGDGSVTSYANLADCHVQDGQFVKQGTVIGSLGRENQVLHFEIWQDSRSLDPSGLWDGE